MRHRFGIAMALTGLITAWSSASSPVAPDAAEGKGWSEAGRDNAAVRTAIVAIFAPYQSDNTDPAFDRPIFSAAVQKLIEEWKRNLVEGEVTSLGESDWICQCQDWDPAQFRIMRQTAVWTGDDSASVRVDYAQTSNSEAKLLEVLKREDGAWKIDDMIFADQEPSLTARLRTEISEARSASGGKP